MQRREFSDRVFTITDSKSFESVAFDLFRYQSEACPIYKDYLAALKIAPATIDSLEKIPFLPIDFFKKHDVISGSLVPEVIFTSSGTTGQTPSRHAVHDASIYIRSFTEGFRYFYGNEDDYVILALLPSYLERSGSSLIYMCEHLIAKNPHPESGFYLYNHADLLATLKQCAAQDKKTLLIGVTFGLLDFAETLEEQFPDLIIMETGGMKGRREEWIRPQVHAFLTQHLGAAPIHSEYGMTELLSQAYSKGDGLFSCPPWMKILRREVTDPLTSYTTSGSGALNVIDLANIDSCAFIATQDLCKVHDQGVFEVLGRYDHAEVRGCNLMVG
jgi:phenylacetate-coenzyme A ligase PaaK-like adenylate-forming protein